MAERMTASWTSAPHFYLVREVNVSRLITWRERVGKQTGARITYTDLLVKLVAAVLVQHPRANASWKDGGIVRNADINIGVAVARSEEHTSELQSRGHLVCRLLLEKKKQKLKKNCTD